MEPILRVVPCKGQNDGNQNGAANVLEESNLTATIPKSQITKILDDEPRAKLMSERALHFAKLDATEVIAREILEIALKHEKS
ncbi:MAG: hypothetical protein Q7R93_05575 [bacterium]|nr:hypothetical protein [bacterium]